MQHRLSAGCGGSGRRGVVSCRHETWKSCLCSLYQSLVLQVDDGGRCVGDGVDCDQGNGDAIGDLARDVLRKKLM